MKIFEKTKNWVKENKGKIVIGVTGIVAMGVIAVLTKSKDEPEDLLTDFDKMLAEPHNFGRELVMEFKTLDGEVLGKVGCCEMYMDDMMDTDCEGVEDYRKPKDET